MKKLRLFEDFDKKFVVIGKWTDPDENDGKEQWDILSREPVTYDEAIIIKKKSREAWTNNGPEYIEHHEYILTLDEYQKMLSEDPEYQKDIMKKYNV